MPSADSLVVRLVVWEGRMREGNLLQAQIKEHVAVLKRLVNESVEGTRWSYQRWKLFPSQKASQKFEIWIRHDGSLEQQEKSTSLHQLCDKLLNSELATELRLQYPAVSFTFTPSQEGSLSTTDKIFARCFSTALVRRYCLGSTYSEELERRRNEFLTRNSTKYLHGPMLTLLSAAEFASRYDAMILTLVGAAEMINGDRLNVLQLADATKAVTKRKTESSSPTMDFQMFAEEAVRSVTGGMKSKIPRASGSTQSSVSTDEKFSGGAQLSKLINVNIGEPLNGEEVREAAKLAVAIGCRLVRSFVAYSAELKKELAPKLKDLNQAIIKVRLALASDAYLRASTAPIKALQYLHEKDSPDSDDLAMTINTFGTLMQTTLPLFTVALNITDKEFTAVASLAVKAGVGLVATGGAGVWMMLAGATAGPVGLLAVASASTVAFGAAAVLEAINWSDREKTNPAKVLITIQKVLEECARFLLSLIFIQADMSPQDDSTHLQYVQALRAGLGRAATERLSKKEYQKAYFKKTSERLAKEMTDLKKGLEKYCS